MIGIVDEMVDDRRITSVTDALGLRVCAYTYEYNHSPLRPCYRRGSNQSSHQ